MRYLFADNYRGFCNTYIPIKDVNFLVGENSTGKTSILHLIELFSSMQFWMEQDFNSDGIELGSFKDIVSAEVADKSFFKIGQMAVSEKNGKRQVNAYYFKFVDSGGMPCLAEHCYIENMKEVRIMFVKDKVYYIIKNISCGRNKDFLEHILNVYGGWVANNTIKVENFKELKGKFPLGKRVPLPFLRGFLLRNANKKLESNLLPVPWSSAPIESIAPIRTKPRRTYDQLRIDSSPDGVHTPYLIKRILDDSKRAPVFKKYLGAFGNSSGLFKSVDIRPYGKSVEDPFALEIELFKNPVNINNVGYGVSQCLPVIVELFLGKSGFVYVIQQPEIHLHPRAQAALGDLFFESSAKQKKTLFIETHSDYLIDRFRSNLSKSKSGLKLDTQVLFFERAGGGNKVTKIDILGNGQYSLDQPKNFREFFLNEELHLLEI